MRLYSQRLLWPVHRLRLNLDTDLKKTSNHMVVIMSPRQIGQSHFLANGVPLGPLQPGYAEDQLQLTSLA